VAIGRAEGRRFGDLLFFWASPTDRAAVPAARSSEFSIRPQRFLSQLHGKLAPPSHYSVEAAPRIAFINQMETMSPAKLAGSDISSGACDIIERSRGPPCKVPSIS
jgi:hypothetical protein